MNPSRFTIRHCLVTLALVGFAFLVAPEVKAITYGEPDCVDNRNNEVCAHPNTASLASFRRTPNGTLVATLRCSGTLIAEDANRFIMLTAGHCASRWFQRLQNGTDVDVGVSFDAEIIRDLPQIGPVAWTPRQYILGGQAVLPADYGPTFSSWVTHFDYGVVVFDIPEALRITADRFGRPIGNLVDLSGIPPVTLPEHDYLLDKVSANAPLMVTTVGYGYGEMLNGPGDGGNTGGPDHEFAKLGVRWMAENTSAFSFMGREQHLFLSSQNPARDHDGSCYGDSGGPLFYVDQGVEIQIGINSSGDHPCRATGFNVRTDGARISEFLTCVLAQGAEFEDILACGCTEVNDKGVCSAE